MRHLFVWYGPRRAIVVDDCRRELVNNPEALFAAILEGGAVVEVLKGSAYTGGTMRSRSTSGAGSALSRRTPEFIEAEAAAKRFDVEPTESTDNTGIVYGG